MIYWELHNNGGCSRSILLTFYNFYDHRDGTTDVTRTMHFGTPSKFEKECFTRVLKGQIQLATCIFPEKIKGNYLDAMARKYLWDVGLDYFHGTSHGIGHYLNVHEGPIGITWRPVPDDPGLQQGMFLSNGSFISVTGALYSKFKTHLYFTLSFQSLDIIKETSLEFDSKILFALYLLNLNTEWRTEIS